MMGAKSFCINMKTVFLKETYRNAATVRYVPRENRHKRRATSCDLTVLEKYVDSSR
jgi:hypothetical protein